MGSFWKKNEGKPFKVQRGRRIYLCPHKRRREACRACNGVPLVAKSMLCAAKWRAKRDGVPFDLTLRNVLDLLSTGRCPVFDVPYRLGGGCNSDYSPSLDKFNPILGYVVGNVYVISNLANRIKTNATPDQIRKVAEWVARTEAQQHGRN